MTSQSVPNYVIRFCEDLNETKWHWFYKQMKNSASYVADMSALFYVLKWILKNDFDDLLYEIYFQDYCDPEMRAESLIKDEYQDALQKRYGKRLAEDTLYSREYFTSGAEVF